MKITLARIDDRLNGSEILYSSYTSYYWKSMSRTT